MDTIDNHKVYEPLRLTLQQQRVLEALKDKETEKYPVSKWYLGALYALDNPHNPDRISQAGQSLRELLEKLPFVVQGLDTQRKGPRQAESEFPQMRSNMEEHILRYKESNPGEWEGQKIDNNLAEALRITESYLELNKQPTRRERMQMSVAAIDPMANRFDSQIRDSKRDRLYRLWRKLEDFAHHSRKQDYESFNKCLEDLERTVFDLLAPITAQDQKEIQTILNCADRSEADINRMFSIIERRGANYVFFFKQAAETADTSWLSHLGKRGYLANPPNTERIGEDLANFPFWWPLHYLAKISKHAPDQVTNLVLGLFKVDNPSVYEEILTIALQLRGEESAKLMPKILESLELEHQVWTYQYADLLGHWTKENQVKAALQLATILVTFVPDPQDKDKRKRRGEKPQDLAAIATMAAETRLKPSPRIDHLEYCEIMSKGVRPLAEKVPYKVALLLVNTTANMIRLRTHEEGFEKDFDYSEYWCERLVESERDYEAADKSLVHTLTFACQSVYEKEPDSIRVLDDALRNKHWRIFKRLRQHLYAQYPREQTKPWIREMILAHEDYHRWEHSYEYQQMIQSACQHFGMELLTEDERKHIFDCILNGPSKDGFTEEEFKQHQRRFHRKQLKPFAPVLFREYNNYFQQLETEAESQISDDDYPPLKTRGGHLCSRSPRSQKDLEKLTDEEMLTFINEWDERRELFEGNNLIEVDIGGLASAFQTVFTQQIIPDSKRLKFWMDIREKIESPIYVRMMINGMQTDVKKKHFDRLNDWLAFSEWVLSHPDQVQEGNYRLGREGDESREIPSWYNSRRAVGDFIATCLQKDVDVPIVARKHLAKLLEMLCTQFDSWLDRDKRVFSNQNDLVAEGINNTRSLALETLVKFGFWLQGHDSESEILDVTTILEKRFAPDTERLLTLPEYAILGKDYPRIFHLNDTWATAHKSDFFPQCNLSTWLAAFYSFMHYNRPSKAIFEILKADFDFALCHLNDFKKQDFSEKTPAETLGEHLFHYYLLEMYPLKGGNSLLERYYQATNRDRKPWVALFNNVGHSLRNTGEHLDESLKDRIIDFFDWRYEVQEPTELQQFAFWLKAKCLDAEWRLDAFSKILDVCKAEGVSIAMQVESLCVLLPNHTAKVIECFTKLTDGCRGDNIYIRTEKAKIILKAGLGSDDPDVRQHAKRAHENLLSVGKSDLLDADD